MSASILNRIARVLGCVLVSCAAAAAQTTWYVDGSATPPGAGTPASPYASIQYAIDRPTTVAGDTVLVAPGTYFESLSIFKAITVKSGQGPLATILRPAGTLDGIQFSGTATWPVLEGFTVQASTQASGIYAEGGIVRRCIIRDCTSIAGIECPSGRIESSTIVGNQFGVLGAGLGIGTIRISDSIVWGNAQANVDPTGGALIESFNAGFGSPANGSIPGDPGLWNLAERDVRPRPGSPCIDAGDPTGALDPDGSRKDIGALVYDPTYAPGPMIYCAGKPNSQGCTPAIAFTGSASATSPAPFTISATLVIPAKPALLLLGSGKSAVLFQGGTLCVAQPIRRIGAQTSLGAAPCSGTLAFDMRTYLQSGANPALVPGALASVQWWGRDQSDPAGFGSSLSDAVYFGVAP